jgi:hypothetical protein
MAKKAKGFGSDNYVKSKRRKRPGRHAKHHKGKKRSGRGQGFPI